MAKLSIAEKLDVAVKDCARATDSSVTSLQAAEEFYADEAELVEPFVRVWVIRRLAQLIGKHRAQARRESQPQLMFEEALGFKRLPKRIEVEPGKRVPRAEATIGVFRRLAARLSDRESPALEAANRAIALMATYTPDEPRITWGKVVELEAEKKAKATK